MLNEALRREFEERGIVLLPGAFSPEAAARMEARLWGIFEHRYGATPDDPDSWAGLADPTGLRSFRRDPVFAHIGSPEVRAAIDGLLGVGRWQEPKHWGQFLISFPKGDLEWCLPHQLWHTDFPYLDWREERPFGLLLFSFLSAVPARSGGTLVVEGSHRIVRRFLSRQPAAVFGRKMKQVRLQLMASEPWLKQLGAPAEAEDEPARIRRFMDETAEIDGTPLRVRELTGVPGDVVLAHPWILHSIADNCGTRPRLMCVQRLRLASRG